MLSVAAVLFSACKFHKSLVTRIRDYFLHRARRHAAQSDTHKLFRWIRKPMVGSAVYYIIIIIINPPRPQERMFLKEDRGPAPDIYVYCTRCALLDSNITRRSCANERLENYAVATLIDRGR